MTSRGRVEGPGAVSGGEKTGQKTLKIFRFRCKPRERGGIKPGRPDPKPGGEPGGGRGVAGSTLGWARGAGRGRPGASRGCARGKGCPGAPWGGRG